MSDLSAFHRVDDLAALTISRFLMLATRLAAYSGALRARFSQSSVGMASPPDVSVTAGVPSAGGGGDTPPAVLHALKAQQFADRHGKYNGAAVDPAGIRWDNDEILRELVKG